MTSLPSGTVTLLFSDIEGSTRLLRRLGARYEALLTTHRELLRDAFVGAGGVEVEARGDSFLVAFTSARGAVDGAVAAQRALAEHAWPDGVQPRVRIGIHSGEPSVSANDYVGIDVHRASRIGDAAHGGQVLVSESTRALVGDTIALRELGEFRLEGLEATERLYQVVAPGLDSDFAPPRAKSRPRGRRTHPQSADDLTKLGWRVHGLGSVAPAALLRAVSALAGAVLDAAKEIDAADQTLLGVDRNRVANTLADYRSRASAAPHVAEAARDVERRLAALDRLPERRRALEEELARLDDDLDTIERRLKEAPRSAESPALTTDLDERRLRVVHETRLLEDTRTAAPPPAIAVGRLHRTLRRGIFRAGNVYVVLEADELGVKRPRPAGSLDEAIRMRASLRAARRFGAGPRPFLDERHTWEDKSSSGSSA